MAESIYYAKFRFEFHNRRFDENRARLVCNIPAKELYWQDYHLVTHPYVDHIEYEEEVTFQDGIYLSDEEIARLLPYIEVEKYEKYRNIIGFLDGKIGDFAPKLGGTFYGFTDSPIPYIKIDVGWLFWNSDLPTYDLFLFLDKIYLSTGRLKMKA